MPISLKKALGTLAIAAVTSITAQANAQSYVDFGAYQGTPGWEANYFVCAGVSGGNMSNGTPFVFANCNANKWNGFVGARDQAFWVDTSDYIEAGGFFYYSIRDSQNSSKCMGVSGGSTSNNAGVVIWDCKGTSHPDQYWLLFPDSSTGCNIVYNYNSGLRLSENSSTGYLMQTSSTTSWPAEWCPHSVAP